jgi:flavin-dependent dehydrogenase
LWSEATRFRRQSLGEGRGGGALAVRDDRLRPDAYSFLQIFPQDQHERLLIERLEQLGVSVERRTELIGFTDERDRVTAHLRAPEGREDVCKACYIAGCDGARSFVREAIGTGYPGGTYRQVFTSPMSKRPVPQSTASRTSISTKPISWQYPPWPEMAGLDLSALWVMSEPIVPIRSSSRTSVTGHRVTKHMALSAGSSSASLTAQSV